VSTQQPGTPRRRRIAGERRRPAVESPERQLTPTPPRYADSRDSVDEARGPVAPLAPAAVSLDKTDRGAEVGPSEDVDDRAPETEPGSRHGWWGSRASLALLGALLALLLAGVAVLALGVLGSAGIEGVADVRDAQAVDRTTRTAPPAAEAAAAAILAYDYRTLDADEDTAARFMTNGFAKQYTDTFERVVRPAAEQNQARVTATVQASGVIRATPDTARVLVFVDQSTSSKANPDPQVALNRVEMSMVREGGSWLVDDISSY
jgi:F0F1-type ATP synthase membrane subunit c/vacuolar-type H+-ATPase subunit K